MKSPLAPSAVVTSPGVSRQVVLAAAEIRRFYYLRTGVLLLRREGNPHESVWLGTVADLPSAFGGCVRKLEPQEYEVFFLPEASSLMVVGGDALGCLYGAYALAESWGVRFYLHGDELPAEPMSPSLTPVALSGSPTFQRRGLLPFHDFPEGPDWWEPEDYALVIAQMARMRMNFIGFHSYPANHPTGPEPGVWMGLEEDVADDGSVLRAFPATYFHTEKGTWGYRPMKTSDYPCGAARLFVNDDFTALPGRQFDSLAEDEATSVARFNAQGDAFHTTFSLARMLGIETAMGTESPLAVPATLAERLRGMGLDPEAKEVQGKLYTGIFKRLHLAHRLDWYWFWSGELWTWNSPSQAVCNEFLEDVLLASKAIDAVGVPIRLATAGWVLGPAHDRASFDQRLPEGVVMSAISRDFGNAPIDRAFKDINSRPTWAMPWLEGDPDMTQFQLHVGRTLRDAHAAARLGCEGLIGLHWRLRVLGPNVSALAHAGWKLPLPPSEKMSEGGEGFLGGMAFLQADMQVKGPLDAVIYQSSRFDFESLQLRVPNGAYAVTLHLSSGGFCAPGERVLNWTIQHDIHIAHVDPFAEVGPKSGCCRLIHGVRIKDGCLLIECLPQAGSTALSAIEVSGTTDEGQTYLRKINCGGPAVAEFEACPGNLDRQERAHFPCLDFYRDWAEDTFGNEIAEEAARLFAELDGKFPQVAKWFHGPGGLPPDPRSWSQVESELTFVGAFSELGTRIQHPVHRERFHYWENQFCLMHALAQVRCLSHQAEVALQECRFAANPRPLVAERVLPIVGKLIHQMERALEYCMETITDPSGFGTVTNLVQHAFPCVLEPLRKELSEWLGQDLENILRLRKDYRGETRLIVPSHPPILDASQSFRLRAVVLSNEDADTVKIRFRALGQGLWEEENFSHMGRGHWRFVSTALTEDFEYRVQATIGCMVLEDGEFPKTVVVI